MGSISGFKEYVDKDHPACPLCGGATNKAKLTLSGNLLKLAKTLPSPNAYQGEDVLDLELKRHERTLAVQECVNCGAQNKDGKIVRDSN